MPKTKEQTDERPIIFNGWSIRRILAGEKAQTRRIVRPHPVLWEEECPYGQTGDRLWVREAFRLPASYDDQPPSFYCDLSVRPRKYVADGAYMTNEEVVGTRPIEWGRKRPSIHMPRELCRLRLRVEDVRVERLQEINEDDAMAEGVEPVTRRSTSVHGGTITSASVAFKELWKEIHGTGAWEENPFVWVLEFSTMDTE